MGNALLVLAAGLGGVLSSLGRRAAAHASEQPISSVLATTSRDAITTSLLLAAGVLLLAGVDGGVYVVIPAVIAAMVGGVASAWLFLTSVTA